MAPRRNNSGHSAIEVHNLLGLDLETMDHLHGTQQIKLNDSLTRCCIPTGDCFKLNTLDYDLIQLENIKDCMRVICSNEQCTAGQYMHRECFESWEDGVLSYLKSTGRARSWSDRQRQQNLWTKKGYDLVFKACGCKCGRGYLKKDADWHFMNDKMDCGTGININTAAIEDDLMKKKKKRNRTNHKSILTISANNNINTANTAINNNNNIHMNNMNNMNNNNNNIMIQTTNFKTAYLPPFAPQNNNVFDASNLNVVIGLENCENQSILKDPRHRTSSLSSSVDDCISPPVSMLSDTVCSPIEMIKKEKSKVEAYSERVRSTSGCNGIFSRRLDFSIFNMLPRTRLNSYQIKMEDEGNHGNDETRLFILSSLAQHHKSRVTCVLCEDSMLVFDRYPLVDGTFFLSPKQHSPDCIEVKYEGQIQYLTALCMGCLEGVSLDRIIRCRFCSQKWNGSSLVLGTMYAYDIFAAMPCCPDRLTCNNCFKLLLYPHQRLNFFSDYSHVVSCVHCTAQDTHFVKPLSYCYAKQSAHTFNQWP